MAPSCMERRPFPWLLASDVMNDVDHLGTLVQQSKRQTDALESIRGVLLFLLALAILGAVLGAAALLGKL